MIKIEKIETYGWEAAVRGMRNPMNSWDKSDSYETHGEFGDQFFFGENDLALAKKLTQAGPDHRKFLRQIMVSMDITAPLYWWTEFDTYKVGTVANSCSKMHKLLAKPFEMNDFSLDKLFGYKNEVRQFTPEADEDSEIWRACLVNPDYFISNYGRVRHNGRVLSGSLHSDGYVFVTIKGKQHPKHRLVADIFVQNPDGKPFVNHIDGNKQNCFASNLEWCTQEENVKHARTMGLQPVRTQKYLGKFTAEQRSAIKELWDTGKLTRREIAKLYGVSHTCINDIINDKYSYVERVNTFESVARPIVDTLNEMRDAWLREPDETTKKSIWYSILQLLPESYNQMRTVTLNYEVLLNMYRARKDHKLDEWHKFCDTVAELPYFREVVGC